MDSATGEPSRQHSAEEEFCFIWAPTPLPWIQEHKVARLIRKAHLGEFGIISCLRGGRGNSLLSARTLLEDFENLPGYIYTTKALSSSEHSAGRGSRPQPQLSLAQSHRDPAPAATRYPSTAP